MTSAGGAGGTSTGGAGDGSTGGGSGDVTGVVSVRGAWSENTRALDDTDSVEPKLASVCRSLQDTFAATALMDANSPASWLPCAFSESRRPPRYPGLVRTITDCGPAHPRSTISRSDSSSFPHTCLSF